MSLYKFVVRPVLFRLPLGPEGPETLHRWASSLIRWMFWVRRSKDSQVLRSQVAGIVFPNPVGLAAGFDKDCEIFEQMYQFDFGSVEVGTITPKAQAGNDLPRITRLEKDKAVINRMGFPNQGLKSCLERITQASALPGPLGVNLGANKDSADKIADYQKGFAFVANLADYVTINVSSPNTPGLRSLETSKGLSDLLDSLNDMITEFDIPVFLKVSPDLTRKQIEDTSRAILASNISGVIVGNTTISRPTGLEDPKATESGGLSGQPLNARSRKALCAFYEELGDRVPIVSVGGIASAKEAYSRIKCGASLVQIYTGIIYEGWGLARDINRGLERLIVADGFTNISEAIGADAKQLVQRKRSPETNASSSQVAKPAFA